MRRLLSVLALFVLVLGGRALSAAIAVVQPTAALPVAATQCGGSPSSCDYVMPSQPTAGNTLVVTVSSSSPQSAVMGIGDTGGNAYASTTAINTGGSVNCVTGVSCIQLWYKIGLTTAASFKVTVSTPTVTGALTIFAAEYSGVGSFDKQIQASGTSTTPATASQTATNANSLYVAAIVHDAGGTVTIAGGGTFTERAEAENTANQTQGYEDLIASTGQTGPFTLGTGAAWADTHVIFAPATGSTPTRMLLGVGGTATHRF
jgi:hypothetical protein